MVRHISVGARSLAGPGRKCDHHRAIRRSRIYRITQLVYIWKKEGKGEHCIALNGWRRAIRAVVPRTGSEHVH